MSVDKCYHDINQGVLLIRGENVVLAGEIDPTIDTGMQEVSAEKIQVNRTIIHFSHCFFLVGGNAHLVLLSATGTREG